MDGAAIFIILFGAMAFFHESGHVAYAKWRGIYKGVAIFRLHHLSNKLPERGVWMLPLGAGTETDLDVETLHQRIFNCLCGTVAGLPILLVGWFLLPFFVAITLIALYIVDYCGDLVTVIQIAVIGRQRRWDWNVRLAEVI